MMPPATVTPHNSSAQILIIMDSVVVISGANVEKAKHRGRERWGGGDDRGSLVV